MSDTGFVAMILEKVRVLKVGISPTSYADVVGLCRRWAEQRCAAESGRGHYVCVVSVHGLMLAEDDPEFARILNGADVATPDGMPVVWALRSFGVTAQQRVYGPTLMLEICRAAAETGMRVFLYGGHPESLPVLEARLRERFPALPMAGSFSPPFRALTDEEEREIQATICKAQTDIVLVGIGTPKQERWMFEHRDRFPGVTLVGVGAAFDMHAGRIRQAPGWMQRRGLEWLFRLGVEPGRLWRRYVLVTPRFLPLWAWQKLRSRRPGAV